MKLGKLPARKDAVKFKLSKYVDVSAFPKVPTTFGHETLISSWGMLGNDQYGDCVLAGGGHETMLWNKEAGQTVIITEKESLKDYSAITGFNPNDPNSDQGTDMQAAASYRLKTGLLDASGKRHKVGAYLAIIPGDIREHLLATYLFGAVGIGIEFPSYAMDQFNQGKTWTYRSKHSIEGGHYIPLVARRGSHGIIVTWGKTQPMTDSFFSHFNDESIAYVSEEMLTNGKSPEGFDLNQLKQDLAAL